MVADSKSQATDPLLSDDDFNDANIPPLNAEDPLFGLTDSQVTASKEIFGMNEILIPETPLWKLFAHQFTGFLVRHVILCSLIIAHDEPRTYTIRILYQPFLIELAALISLSVQDWVDFGIILGMLFVNACLAFREEYHAKKSLDELSDQLESEIATRRGGVTVVLNVKELVPGDVVLLVGGTSEYSFSIFVYY